MPQEFSRQCTVGVFLDVTEGCCAPAGLTVDIITSCVHVQPFQAGFNGTDSTQTLFHTAALAQTSVMTH